MKQVALANEKKYIARIEKAEKRIVISSKTFMDDCIFLGDELTEIKNLLGHGNWIPFLNRQSHFRFATSRQASNYIRIAENKLFSREFLTSETSVDGIVKSISDATPEQIAKVEQLKKEEADRIALAETNKALAEAKAAIDNAKKQDDVIDGVFEEVIAPEPEVDVRPVEDPFDVLQETIEMLEIDNSALQTEIESMAKVFESNDQLTTALAEVKKFQELARVLKESLNGAMNSENAAKRQAKMWKAKYERLAKEVGHE